jgi:hypothetical protein
MRSWVASKKETRLRVVESAIRQRCQDCGGVAMISRRTLTATVLFRSSTETMGYVDELVRRGSIRRVSAPGRGRGRGRTVYFLPNASKKRVLRVIRMEGLPHRALVAALSFFSRPKNGTDGDRQQPLSKERERLIKKKDARATRAGPSPPLSGPQRPPPTLAQEPSTSPSLGRLVKHGYRPLTPLQLSMQITDDPATHPRLCECEACLNRSTPDNSR